MQKSKHNGIISLWKFLFSVMIVILHCDCLAENNEKTLFIGGAIAVEFFFITSGYLMAVSAFKRGRKKDIVSDTWNFIGKKFKALFPYVLIAFLSISIVNIIFKSNNIYNWITSIWDLFLLRMTGIKTARINKVAWYLSAMLLSMLIIYPLLRKYKKKYSTFIAPIIVIFLAGYMSHQYGDLGEPMQWVGFCYKGLLRAFLELNIGVILYEVVSYFKKVKLTNLGHNLITFLEVFCFTIVFMISQFLEKGNKLDYIVLVILTVGIGIAFSEKSKFYSFCCNKFFYYLERLSVPIFLNQMAVIYFMEYSSWFSNWNYYGKVAFCLGSLFLFSALTLKVVELWQKNEERIFSFIKNKFILNK